MRHVIAGTAGHIDHGKTTLVRALTGVDTDRLEEEKRRGISIDLGFAHLDVSKDIRIALVDVPGHERFVKNMLAGTGGIDMVLLVIAADESIKPQTREHLDICRLLRIPAGIIALTKCDLVDPEVLQLVHLEVQEFVSGTFLEHAPVIPVSGVSGEGIPEIREALRQAAAAVRIKDDRRLFRMPVDRAFTMTGFGSVVTGTILSGCVHGDDEVQAYPGTATFRVRGVQVHGASQRHALAGQRAALNLAGERTDELARGCVLSHAGLYVPTTIIDCSIDVLPSADPIKNRAPVHFHAGTAEIVGEVRVLEFAQMLAPGETHVARIALQAPALLLPGDRFILRKFSPVVTIAGGHVIYAHPAQGNRAAALARARALLSASIGEYIRILIEESEAGLPISTLVARTGESAADLIRALPTTVAVFGDPPTWLLGNDRRQAVVAGLAARLRDFHRANPLAPGLSKEELRTQHLPGAPAFVFDALLRQSEDFVVTGELVHLKTHRIAFRADEQEALARIEAAFANARLAVPGVSDVLKQSGVEASRAKSLLQILLRNRRLVRINEDLVYHASALEELRGILRARQGQSFAVAQFKEWTGVSRKYAIPLLEYLDREKVTRRQGDARFIL
jgi:selenocysteine-specific elongation factor